MGLHKRKMPTVYFWQLGTAVARLVKALGETAATPVGASMHSLGLSWAAAVGFNLAAYLMGSKRFLLLGWQWCRIDRHCVRILQGKDTMVIELCKKDILFLLLS